MFYSTDKTNRSTLKNKRPCTGHSDCGSDVGYRSDVCYRCSEQGERTELTELHQYRSPSLLDTIKRRARFMALVTPALLAVLISGCSSIDLKRMTYDMLRQQDCLVNEFDEVCTRSFALDYFDYKKARNSYLQSISADAASTEIELQFLSENHSAKY